MDTQCRLCLTEYHDGQLQSMLVPCNESINLWTMYDYIMNVGEFVYSTNAPHICQKCKEDLKSAYIFKVMCAETERTLSERVKIEPSDSQSEIEYVFYDSADNGQQYTDICVDDNVEVCEDSWVEGSGEVFEDDEDDVEIVADVVYDANDEDFFGDALVESVTQTSNAQPTGDERASSKMFTRNCRKCKIQFDDSQAYRVHYRQEHQRATDRKHHKSNARSCPACKINFENVKLYQVHYRRFHKRELGKDEISPRRARVLCSHCGQLFSKSFIGKHLRIKHSVDQKKDHVCTTCGKSFTLIENLIAHKRIHTNDKRFACDVCGEKFLHWATRRNHIRTKHTGEKHYECHLCGEKFTYTSNLYRHIRKHTNELPHACSSCSKGFASKEELKNHQIVHTKVKKEVCVKCLKCFGTRKNLRAHMKIHTGERNYHCTVCDKRFTQPHVLRTHLKTHPGAEMPERGVVLSQKALARLENVSKFVDFEK